jgi:hypothetical protein
VKCAALSRRLLLIKIFNNLPLEIKIFADNQKKFKFALKKLLIKFFNNLPLEIKIFADNQKSLNLP